MSAFEQYLISIGYKRYRKVYDKKEFKYIEYSKGYSFSTMENGGLDYRYLLNGKEIIFGLHEINKPPTLEWPRPKGINSDDEMNRMLKEKPPEEIYKLLML